MGIFSTISHYTTKALCVLGIKQEEAKEVQNSSSVITEDVKKPVDKSTKPIITSKNIQENSDTLKISEEGRANQVKYSNPQKSVNAIQASIRKKCEKYGINDVKLIRELKKHSSMPNGIYEQLSEQDKIELWQGIETILDSMIEVMEKYGTSPQASLEAVILESIKAYEEDVKAGNVPDAKKIKERAGDVNANLGGKKFKNLSKSEKRKAYQKEYIAWTKEKNRIINEELSKCPESMKAQRKKELEVEFAIAEKQRFCELTAVQDTETAYEGLRIMNPDNMDNGLKTIINTRVSEAEKQRFVDEVVTMQSELDLLEDYYARGEKPSKRAVREFNTETMARKSSGKAKEFYENYVTARQSNMYKKLEEDGIFTEMASGIGTGALVNENMTVEEKAVFMKNFYEKEEQFGDAETVKQNINKAVEEYIKKHETDKPQLRKQVEEVNKKLEQKIKASVKNEKTSENKLRKTPESKDYNYTKHEYRQIEKSDKVKENNPKELKYSSKTIKIEKPQTLKTVINGNKIEQVLLTNSFEKAAKDYSIDILAEEILRNKNLSEFLDKIDGYIKAQSPKSLALKSHTEEAGRYIAKTLDIEKAKVYIENVHGFSKEFYDSVKRNLEAREDALNCK